MADVLTTLQDNHGQIIPHKLLEHKDIVKKIIYHLREPIAIIFSAFKELLDFANITGTSYTQHQAVNIEYVIVHRTGKF